jgi:hypothetical protein
MTTASVGVDVSWWRLPCAVCPVSCCPVVLCPVPCVVCRVSWYVMCPVSRVACRVQGCEGKRPDVTHVSLQLMPYPWFSKQRHLYPSVLFLPVSKDASTDVASP